MNNKGITLISAIMLIVFASIAVLGVTVFIIERLNQFGQEENNLKFISLAQAGIQEAIYNFRFRDLTGNGYFPLGTVNIDSNQSYQLSASAADLLMVNTATAATGGSGNSDIRNLSIQNATNSNTVTIARMIISWNNSRTLRIIRINGGNRWTGNLSSPANANITDFTLNTTPTVYAVNYLRFSGNMNGAKISVQFIMTDGLSKTLEVFPASNNNKFTVDAAGKLLGVAQNRTITADYNARTAKITVYAETP